MLPSHPSDEMAPFAVAFAPGGRTVWAAYGDYVLECDAETGRPLRRIEPPEEGGRPCTVKAVAVSPDGRRIALGQNQVHLLETSTGREVARLVAPHLALEHAPALAFTPDGRLLAATSTSGPWNRNLKIWDAASGRILAERAGPRHFLWPDAWTRQIISPDGRRLVTRNDDGGDATIWDITAFPRAGTDHVPRPSNTGAP
jgi:WD40 repeat protein